MLAEQPSTIAPALLFNAENGKPGFELYREFADWIGEEPRFEELQASYRTRIAVLRARISQSIAGHSYAAILTYGGKERYRC